MKKYFAIAVSLSTFTCVIPPAKAAAGLETSSCLLPNNVPAMPSVADWKNIHSVLAPQINNCLRNSDYFALYGASLLYLGNTSKSIEMLERALLLNPNNGAAQVDYAQALYQSGQLLAALQVNAQTLKEDAIPDALRVALEERQAQWQEQTHIWRNQVSYLVGKSSNLNNATYIDRFELTAQDIDINYYINGDDQQKSGTYQYLRFSSQYYSLLDDGYSLLSFSSQARHSKIGSSDTDELSVHYEQNIETLYFSHNWGVGLDYIQLGGDGLYSSFEGSYTISPRESMTFLELDTSHTYFLKDQSLNDVSFMIKPGLLVPIGEQRIGFTLGVGINNALEDRAGSDRLLHELSAFYDFPFMKGRLTSRVSLTKTKDQAGYSPLLANNTPRETTAWSAAVQYMYSVTNNFSIHSSYYYRDQDSNISLFKTKNESFDIGLTYRF